jgi:hypothetical protein
LRGGAGAKNGVVVLSNELSGWPWWDGMAARRSMDHRRRAAKTARRGQSALERLGRSLERSNRNGTLLCY